MSHEVQLVTSTMQMLHVRPWLVVFDLDGTLIDSSLDLCRSVNAALHHVGAQELPHPLISSFIGDGAAMLIRRSLRHSQKPGSVNEDSRADGRFSQALDYFLAFYREHKLDTTRLYEGVLPSLELLRAADPRLPMAVLTNKPVHASREICEGLGIASFFFSIYGGNSFPTKKPSPEGLQTLMTEARALIVAHGVGAGGTEPAQAVLVGDSSTDVLTARRAGTLALGCRYGLAPESLQTEAPDLICESAGEWPRLLGFTAG